MAIFKCRGPFKSYYNYFGKFSYDFPMISPWPFLMSWTLPMGADVTTDADFATDADIHAETSYVIITDANIPMPMSLPMPTSRIPNQIYPDFSGFFIGHLPYWSPFMALDGPPKPPDPPGCM